MLTRPQIYSLFALPFIGLAVMFVFWPFLIRDFPKNLMNHFRFVLQRGTEGPNHFQYEPLVNAISTMPMAVLLLVVIGLVVIIAEVRKRKHFSDIHFLMLLWLLLPVLRVSLPKANDYDVIRHWLEFVPAVAILSGIGGGFLLEKLEAFLNRRMTLSRKPGFWRGSICFMLLFGVIIAFSPVIIWNVQNHPNELVFYNSLVGGLSGAQQIGLPQSTDYWGSSYRQGMRWLNANAEKDSLLIIGVGEHIVEYTEKIWLRSDIQFIPVLGKKADELYDIIRTNSGEVYLMYITRSEMFPDFIKDIEKRERKPIFEIVVDGGTILKIYKLYLE
jgi:hypothetical protein